MSDTSAENPVRPAAVPEERGGWYVSYRPRWWDPRRLYACGNVNRKEAEDTYAYLLQRGDHGARIQGPRNKVNS